MFGDLSKLCDQFVRAAAIICNTTHYLVWNGLKPKASWLPGLLYLCAVLPHGQSRYQILFHYNVFFFVLSIYIRAIANAHLLFLVRPSCDRSLRSLLPPTTHLLHLTSTPQVEPVPATVQSPDLCDSHTSSCSCKHRTSWLANSQRQRTFFYVFHGPFPNGISSRVTLRCFGQSVITFLLLSIIFSQ